jgi:disulfide oxidoreductase YuzD
METTIKRPVATKRPLVTNYRSTDRHSEVIGTMYKTTNYDMFGYFDGNRDTNESHIKNLMESLADKQIPVPIVVDERFRVADGQNRLEACRRLGIPVYYIIVKNLTLKDVKRLNSNVKTWSWQQHMESFIDLGYEDYKTYKEFFNSYEINHTECMQLLLGHTSKRYGNKKGQKTMATAFADGQFRVVQHDKAIRQANMITKVKPFFDDYTHHHFIRALIHLFDKKQDVYNHDLFLKKLEKRNSKLLHQGNRNDYLKNIEEIYNKGSRKKVRLFEYTD